MQEALQEALLATASIRKHPRKNRPYTLVECQSQDTLPKHLAVSDWFNIARQHFNKRMQDGLKKEKDALVKIIWQTVEVFGDLYKLINPVLGGEEDELYFELITMGTVNIFS